MLLIFYGFCPSRRRSTCQPYRNLLIRVHSEKLESPFLNRGGPGDDEQHALAVARRRAGARKHDVSQNGAALIDKAVESNPPYSILVAVAD